MSNSIGRQLGAAKNELARSMGALLGIVQGLICDGQLNDKEIHFLHEWLHAHEAVANSAPANIIYQRVNSIVADGSVTDAERIYLGETLQRFIGGSASELTAQTHVTELAFDRIDTLVYPDSLFCLTGEFAYAARGHCEELIQTLGGKISGVTRKLNYLIVGERGSSEWKHGSFGTKIEKAMELRGRGLQVKIVAESIWVGTISSRRSPP